jgi:hypothetical protein
MRSVLTCLPLLSVFALSACAISGGSVPVRPIIPAVAAEIAVPCQEAAGDKYFMDPDRIIAVSSSPSGNNTAVVLKADSRDALCTLNSKGKVVSLVDTSPKSADQIAAEAAKAAEAAGGKPATE